MTPEQKRAMIAQILAGGMADASGSPLRQRKAMEDAQMKQRQLADTFMAARAAPLESLLMQGDMTPGQMYANAAGNDAPGSGPAAYARERALAGNATAQAPFDPLEALSAPQAMEQALMGSESRAPMTSPRPQPAPPSGRTAAQYGQHASRWLNEEGDALKKVRDAQIAQDPYLADGWTEQAADAAYGADASRLYQQVYAAGPVFAQMFDDMSQQEQSQVLINIANGMSPEEAFAPQGFTTRR